MQTFATSYPAEEKLCIVKHLNEYISRTFTFRKEGMKQLLFGFIEPHSPVSTDTISRWAKSQLFSAGNDTSNFKAHSVRSASSSHLSKLNVNIKDIITSIGWSNEKEQTFNFGKPLLQ